MNIGAFLKDKFLLFLLQAACMILLSAFLRVTGYGADNVKLILAVWIVLSGSWFCVTYLQRRKFFREAEQILKQMDQRFLLGELLPRSGRLEDMLYRDMICKSNRSVIERIRQIEDAQRDYKEYIESWVHEVKGPITGISMICENHRKSGDDTYKVIAVENQRIENYVDMVLYYARSDEVFKDYRIAETDLDGAACEVLEKNRLLLIQNHVQAEVECRDLVYTDRKWIQFILNQMILNSVKYGQEHPLIRIATERTEKGVLLTIEDNGIGIKEEECSRIFDKGFTGSNGRRRERSTGMGLYLCRKLCEKLGIGLTVQSEYGYGTRMTLEFPISNFISH